MSASARRNGHDRVQVQGQRRATTRPAHAPAALITDEQHFDYRGYFGCASHCRLRLFNGAGGQLVAVVTELETNEGTSVTNVAEQLAMFVCDVYQIERSRLVWIEHYPEQAGSTAVADEEFSRVNFTLDGRQEFVNAKWSPLTVNDVAQLTNTDVTYWQERGVEQEGGS